MKKILPFLVLSFSLFVLFAGCGKKAENVVLTNQQDSLSWAMGMSLAQTVKSNFYDFDEQLVKEAFTSVLNGDEQPLDDASYQAACQYIAFLAQKHQREEVQKMTASSAQTEAEYFAKLEQEHPNIKKTTDGYYYEVIKEGKGPKAQLGQRIRFHFRGSNMMTGEVLVESYSEEPIVHVLGNPMFKGMQLGMQLMNAGSHYRFYFPNQLAYGASGSDIVPPYTPVIYEVELQEIYKD